jgi:hypothetical protein
MSHPVTKELARRGISSLLIQLGALVLVGAFFAIACIAAYVAPVGRDGRIIVWALVLFVQLMAFVVVALAFAMSRTGALDGAFSVLGLRASGFMPNLRYFSGNFEGREMRAMWARRQRMLEISIEHAAGTKAAFTRQETVGRAREFVGLKPLGQSSDPAMQGIIMAADDAAWTSRFIAQHEVAQALQHLLYDPTGREVRWVMVRPGCVKVSRRWLDPDSVQATLTTDVRALAALVRACESTGRAEKLVVEGGIERAFRTHPTRSAFLVIAALFAVLIPIALIPLVLVLLTR